MKNKLFTLILLFSSFVSHAQSGFKSGDVEASGAMQYQTLIGGTNPYSTLAIIPNVSLYLTNACYFGPFVKLGYAWTDNFSSSTTALGGNLGLILPTKTNVQPYLGAMAGFLYNSYTNDYGSNFMGSDHTSIDGNLIVLYGGFKFAVAQNVYFNFQPGFNITSYSNDVGQQNSDYKSFELQFSFSAKIFSKP